MSAKHTPGPWLIATQGEPPTFVYALNDQGYNRFWTNVSGGNAAPMERTTDAELEANTRLIAAAPDLLEELADLIDIAEMAMREANRDGGEYDIAGILQLPRAAIAKATGGKQ